MSHLLDKYKTKFDGQLYNQLNYTHFILHWKFKKYIHTTQMYMMSYVKCMMLYDVCDWFVFYTTAIMEKIYIDSIQSNYWNVKLLCSLIDTYVVDNKITPIETFLKPVHKTSWCIVTNQIQGQIPHKDHIYLINTIKVFNFLFSDTLGFCLIWEEIKNFGVNRTYTYHNQYTCPAC